MRGTIVSQDKHRMEFCDLRGTTHRFWRTKGGFWLGENGRLYMVNRLNHRGRQGRYQELELMSIGRSHGFHRERTAGEQSPRPVKDRMAGDHLRHLYKEKELTLGQIADRYDTGPQYILKLLREYEIAGRPPGRRPEVRGFEKPKEYRYRATLQRIAQALLDHPGRANAWIADELKLKSDHRTVARVRRELERGGHIPIVEKVLRRDGKWYTVKREEKGEEDGGRRDQR